MKILFDHCTPQKLRGHLPGHLVTTARERGWERLQNGRLIEAAEADGFDLMISADQSIRYQQNLASRTIALLVLTSPRWPRMKPQAAAIAQMVGTMKPGEYREFAIS